jgi:ABC-type glycerol-3-phosphate transport system substrate-binding protein
MKKIAIKAASIALVLSMALSQISCDSNTNKKTRKITADTPWYNAEIIDFKPEINTDKELESVWQYIAGADKNYIVMYSDGMYRVDNWSYDITYDDYSIKLITLIDRNTKQTVKTINLHQALGNNDYPLSAAYSNGKIILLTESYDINKGEFTKMYELDPDTESVLITRDLGPSHYVYQNFSFDVGDYRVDVRTMDENQPVYCELAVSAPDGSMTRVEVRDPVEGIYEIPFVFALDKNTALVAAAANRINKYYELDLSSGRLTSVSDDEYSWLDDLDIDILSSVFNDTDGNVFLSTSKGISRISLKDKTTEDFFDYGWCNINRSYTNRITIADCSKDSLVLGGRYTSSNMFKSEFTEDYVIIELTKADKNPHAGKKILELYIPEGEMNEIISDAIIEYNESDNGYFIQVTDRYETDKYMKSFVSTGNYDDFEAAKTSAFSQMGYELAMDIMNGEGPDIIMNTSNLGQLNNDNYLIDLSTYVADLDPNEYFTNIIDGAKIDGKLYQLPISFTLKGIQTDPQNAGSSGIGFTTEEYKSFLYGPLNGRDVIESGKVLYFTKIFNGMSDVFIKNGKADFTCSEFAELAEYVNDCVQEKIILPDDDNEQPPEDDYIAGRNKTAYYCNCPGISGYLVKRGRMNDATAILGIPSSDGRGPMFGTNISVAISSHTENSEACIKFMRLLISDEVQAGLVLNDNFVLSRQAFRKGSETGIDFYNGSFLGAKMYDYSIGTNVVVSMKFSTEDIDDMERIIMSCSKMDSPDASIDLIIMEEMPAYFSGQKDLKSVVNIMQDRVQKILDERG